MKKYLLILSLMPACLLSRAQSDPKTFLLQLPSPPVSGTVCNTDDESRHAYRESMHTWELKLDEEIAGLRKDDKKKAAMMQYQAEQKVAADYNLSAADMEKLKSGKMTPEQKKAMADKMLQQQGYSMTVDEARDVSKMSKAGKQAWAESMAAEQMAEAEKDPKKNVQDQKNAKSLVEMTEERDQLFKKLSAFQDKYAQRIAELDTNKTYRRMLAEIDSLTKEYNSMVGVDYGQGAKMDQIAGEIKSRKMAYCSGLTPKYLSILSEYKDGLLKNLPDYYRLEELTNEINKKTSGTTVDMASKGLMAFEAIKPYFTLLADAYRYSIYTKGNPY